MHVNASVKSPVSSSGDGLHKAFFTKVYSLLTCAQPPQHTHHAHTHSCKHLLGFITGCPLAAAIFDIFIENTAGLAIKNKTKKDVAVKYYVLGVCTRS